MKVFDVTANAHHSDQSAQTAIPYNEFDSKCDYKILCKPIDAFTLHYR